MNTSTQQQCYLNAKLALENNDLDLFEGGDAMEFDDK